MIRLWVDNTNRDVLTRSSYIEIARSYSIPIRFVSLSPPFLFHSLPRPNPPSSSLPISLPQLYPLHLPPTPRKPSKPLPPLPFLPRLPRPSHCAQLVQIGVRRTDEGGRVCGGGEEGWVCWVDEWKWGRGEEKREGEGEEEVGGVDELS